MSKKLIHGKLIIARHHESEWNKLGKWTGLHDSHLTDYGKEKSGEMGGLIKDLTIDLAFTSALVRTKETLACMLQNSGKTDIPTESSVALNERNYGDYMGKNKWEVKKLVGEEEFNQIRRGWDKTIPNGESLKMVYDRTLPFFQSRILPALKESKNVLIVASGNSIRALMKYIENISDSDIANTEMPFGAVVIYDLDADGHMVHKEVRQVESKVNA